MALKRQYGVAVVNEDILNAVSTVTFAESSTTSSILECGGTAPLGIFLPASWLASTISFNVAKFPGIFYPMKNVDGSAFGINSSAGLNYIPLQAIMFNSIVYIQIVSSVAQPAMTVDFSLAPVFQNV